ncbi:MAG: DUF1801 domain-containing protein [Bacteroidota bacterium]
MSGLATKETNRSVDHFIENIDSPSKQEDSRLLLKMIGEITGWQPKVWGNEKVPDFLIGFGNYTYTRKGSKEEFEWFHIGFAPRKSKLTLYLPLDLDKQGSFLNDLGKCSWGRGCLYLNKLADVDLEILRRLISHSRKSVQP